MLISVGWLAWRLKIERGRIGAIGEVAQRAGTGLRRYTFGSGDISVPSGLSDDDFRWSSAPMASHGMSISSLKLFKVAVPLKKVVRHASFERSVSENLVVRVTLSDGITGYGEGVPRSYVTGETLESTFAALESTRLGQRDRPAGELCRRSSSGWRHLTLPEIESDPRGMSGNAARCALELAILDAYGRRFG